MVCCARSEEKLLGAKRQRQRQRPAAKPGPGAWRPARAGPAVAHRAGRRHRAQPCQHHRHHPGPDRSGHHRRTAEAREKPDARVRGRPATLVGFNRGIGAVCARSKSTSTARACRWSIMAASLVDRIETPLTPDHLCQTPPGRFPGRAAATPAAAQPAEAGRLRRIAISVQGILDRDGARPQVVAHRPSRRPRHSPASWPSAFGLPVTLLQARPAAGRGRALARPGPARRQRRHGLCRLDRRHGHDLSRRRSSGAAMRAPPSSAI